MLDGVKVYLVRHADAVSEDVAGRDEDRWLSARGREAARGLARLLREQGVEPDAILSSPLPRAMQTAELIANALDFLGVVEVLPALRPGAHPRVAAQELITRGDAVLVVGHEPSISSLGAFLLGIPSFPSMRTAQACAIVDGAPTFSSRADVMQTVALFV
jgi:phosphohistidine phosphatase